MSTREQLTAIYFELLGQQVFDFAGLDDASPHKYERPLELLAVTSNSAVSIFDKHQQKHVFYSSNYLSLFGFPEQPIPLGVAHFLDERIHPDDVMGLIHNGISVLKLFNHFSPEQKASYKLINEYRVLNAQNKYIRVIEQDQLLAFDNAGNMWLSMSVIDLAPNQETTEGLKSQLLNFKTGKLIALHTQADKPAIVLSAREKEILELVKQGLLSKEISGMLAISVHTVNTHRQRILEKLGANNSMEAVLFAARFGLC